MVVCNCLNCGAELEVPEGIAFEGALKEAVKYIEQLVVEKSEQCPCRSAQDEMV